MEESTTWAERFVSPVDPVAPYLGGKRNLAETIISYIDAIPHLTYAEPFVGMGGVFLRRRRVPRAEVINDINRDVATSFRVLQRHYVAFMEMMKYQITTRAEFERLVATDPDTLTDLERAARFLYLQRCAYGGKSTGQTFGVAGDRPGRFDITKLGPMLEDLHTRLSGIIIECLPFGDFIQRYDGPDTLFYLDPPYWGGETDYGKDVFARSDFRKLAQQMCDIEGRFILSINDVSEIRNVFDGFEFKEVEVTYTIGRDSGKQVGELLISKGPLTTVAGDLFT